MAQRSNDRSRVDPAVLRAAVQRLIADLQNQATLHSIERLLGLSQGYLSRLKLGAGQPSQPLVCLLWLLVEDRGALSRLSADMPASLALFFEGGEHDGADLGR